MAYRIGLTSHDRTPRRQSPIERYVSELLTHPTNSTAVRRHVMRCNRSEALLVCRSDAVCSASRYLPARSGLALVRCLVSGWRSVARSATSGASIPSSHSLRPIGVDCRYFINYAPCRAAMCELSHTQTFFYTDVFWIARSRAVRETPPGYGVVLRHAL